MSSRQTGQSQAVAAARRGVSVRSGVGCRWVVSVAVPPDSATCSKSTLPAPSTAAG